MAVMMGATANAAETVGAANTATIMAKHSLIAMVNPSDKTWKTPSFTTMKQKAKYKKGDLVFTVGNFSWGLKPMEVTEATDSYVRCKHPDFSGIGLFYLSEIVPCTSKRKNEILQLMEAMTHVKDLRRAFFQ